MISLRLTAALDEPLDLTGITPDSLADLSLEAVKRLKVPYGRGTVRLGEVFTLRGTPDTTLVLSDLTPRVRGLGAGMRAGTLRLRGRCGDGLGAGMRGGEIRLEGTARDRLGAGMRGGLIAVDGSIGDFAGAGLPGATSGMKGGTILVSGSAGARTGDRMRRGVIVVAGDVGAGVASQMIAGTIVALGAVGDGCAIGMRRGSLLMRARAFEPPSTFVHTGDCELAFVAVLTRFLTSLNPALSNRLRAFRAVTRWVGDRGCDGLGEILVGTA